MKLPASISKIVMILSKLLMNKYVLYIIAFLSLTNLVGYMLLGNLYAVILFILVGLTMTNFSKNMAIILLVPLVVTNLFMGAAVIKEGLDNMNTSKDPSGNSIKTNLQNKQATTSSTNSDDDSQSVLGDKDISNAKKIMTNAENAKNSSSDVTTTNSSAATTTPESFEGTMNNNLPKKGGSTRIDYGTTVENAYDDLNKILGGDGIKQLTGDTQKLMQQQMKLAEAMNNMGPMLQTAKDMLKSLDLKSLGNLSNIVK
jgi:hypothetical protein